MSIRAIFFDMGGTIDTYGYTRQLRLGRTPGLREILRSAGLDLSLTDESFLDLVSRGLEKYHAWSLESLEELSPGRVWADYIMAGMSFDEKSLAGIAEELMCYVESRYYDRRVRPEVRSVLDELRRMRLPIGIISNVNSKGQVPKMLAEYEIIGYFEPIVLSSEYGRRKPDPGIFLHAARLAGVSPEECAFVGDRIARDIVGARQARFSLAVQILHDFDHGEVDDGATPDFVITRMTELLEIVRSRIGAVSEFPGSDH